MITRGWRNGLLALTAAAVFFLAANEAQAYQIKRIIRGQAVMSTNETFSVDLTSALGATMLDQEKTFLYFTSSDPTADKNTSASYGIIDDDHTLTFSRNGAVDGTLIEYQVVEFVSGVTVTSGITPFSDSGTTAALKTITIPTIDRTKTFVMLSWKAYNVASSNNQNNRDSRWQWRADFSATNKLRIQRLFNGGNPNNFKGDVAYQIVAFDATETNVDVQYGTNAMAIAAGSPITIDLTTAGSCNNGSCHSVALNKSFVIASQDWGSTNGNDGDEAHQADVQLLCNAGGGCQTGDRLRFNRGVTTTATNISWFIVTLNDAIAGASQSGRVVGNATTTPSPGALSGFILGRSLALVNTSLTGTNTTGNPSLLVRTVPSGTTVVTHTRSANTTNVNASWYLTEFAPLKMVLPNGTEGTWTVGETKVLTWGHSADMSLAGSCNSSVRRAVQIDGYVNGGYQNIYSSYTNGAATHCADSDTYSWTIPDVLNSVNVIGTGFKVKVSAEEDVSMYSRNNDESDATITIVGAIDAPTMKCTGGGGSCASGTETLLPVGATDRVIRWTQHGNLGRVKLSVSTNGTTWNDGAISLGNLGGKIATIDPATYGGCSGSINNRSCDYAWNPIPDLASATLQVRVLQADATGSTLNGSDISSSNTANPRLFTTAANHGLVVGNVVEVRDHSVCNGQYTIGTQPAANTFTLTGCAQGAAGTNGTVTKRIGGTATLLNTTAAFEIRPTVTVTYPTGTTKAITQSTNATPIVVTATAHGFSTGDTVTVAGVTPNNTNANGTWVITKIDANSFSLNSSAGNIANGGAVGTVFRGDSYNRGIAYTSATTPKTITWTTTGTIPTYDIWLSYDGGTTYLASDKIATTLAACGSAPCYSSAGSNPTTNTFNWTPTATQKLGVNCKIAVVKAGTVDPTAYTIGDIGPDAGVFSVVGSLSMSAPVASQANPTWKVGGNGQISWAVTGGSGVTLVNVQYATDCTGTNCATTGTWNNLPGGVGLNLDAAQNGWVYGPISTSLQGAQIGIKIMDASNPTLIYDQKGPFSVKLGLSNATSQGSLINTNDIFRVGQTYSIGWTPAGTPPGGGLSVYYNINGGTYTAFSPDLTGKTSPTNVIFPSSAFINDNVTLKIFDPADGSDLTNGVVLVSPAFRVKADVSAVTLKKGGSVSAAYNYGDIMNISWTLSPAGYTPNVDILYTTNNGADNYGLPGSGQKIATVPMSIGGAAATGNYDWTINTTAVITGSANVKFRVVKSDDTNVTADSGVVQVRGKLVVDNPTGPWSIGTQQSLTYTANGIADIEIMMATDGSSFNSIVATTPSTGSYTWNPLANNFIGTLDSTALVKFRIRNAADPTEVSTTSTTSNSLTIKKRFINFSPANNSTPVGTLYVDDNDIALSNLIWTSQGSTSNNIILDYDTASGTGGYGSSIFTGSDAGGKVWQVPDVVPPKTTMRVRIKSSADATVVAETADFTIRGKIDQLTPSLANVSYNYGAPIAISWWNHGTLGNVRVQVAADGTNYSTIKDNLASTANALNTWTWTTGETGFNPPAVGSTYKVKVLQIGDTANVYAASANNFKIKGVLALTTLTGSDNNAKWANVSDVKAITWNKSPSTFGDGAMELYYSTAGLATCAGAWTAIDPSPGSFPNGTGASWNWTVPPAAISSGLTLKLQTTAGCSDTFAISSATAASVKGALYNIAVAESPTLEIRPNPAYSISWSSNPSAQGNVNVNLYNGAVLQRTLATVASETSPYSYTIPNNELSNDYDTDMSIKVELVSDASNVFTASAPLTIKKKYASVGVPSGVLRVDDETALLSGISWVTYGNNAPAANYPVILAFDTGANTFPTDITSSIPDTSPYIWRVPDSIGLNRKVRVKSSSFPNNVFGDSSAFEIKGRIDTLSPSAGGLVYDYNSPITIQWTNHGSLGAINIKMASDGTNFTTTLKALGSSTNNGVNTWIWNGANVDTPADFPPPVGTTYKIRVEQNSDAANVSAVSGNNFKVQGILTLTALTSADNNSIWARAGASKNITWNKSPSAFADGSLQLFYSTTGKTVCADGGDPWQSITGTFPNGTGASWGWTIPAAARTATLTLKLQTTAGCSDAFAISAATNASVKGDLSNLVIGGTYPILTIQPAPAYSISWTSSPSAQGNVNINLYNGAALLRTIATVASETSPYSYTVPDNELSNDYNANMMIKVELATDATNVHADSGTFTMLKKYENVALPSGVVRVDDVNAVNWNTRGNKTPAANYPVVLAYDTGGNTFAGQINSGNSMPDNETYAWTIPDSIGLNRKVRVTSSTFPANAYGDTSTFEIKGKIDTLTPSAGSPTYDYNSPIAISWFNHGTLGAMTVKLATDGTNFSTTIKSLGSSTNNALNTYTWTTGEAGFPPAVGTTYKIKVEQNSDTANVNAASATNFKVKGLLALTSGNTDGIFGSVGNSANISWTKNPTTFSDNQIYLYFSTTGATTCSDGSWTQIAPAPNTTTGSPATWGWTIPQAALTSTLRLKIQDASSADCSTVTSFDISDAANLAVKGNITSVTTAGAPWLLGGTYNVGWASNPSAQGNVLIEVSLNGGAYSPVTGNAGTSTVTSQSSPFAWTIQESLLSNDYEANATVRVKLISDPNNVVAQSSAFTIKKRYTTVAVPTGTLVVGESNNITWNTFGNTGAPNQVVLSFDTNGGANGFAGQINSGNPLTDSETYSWTVPDSIGANRVVRVQSNAFPSDVSGVSGTFNIKGKVVADPNQGTVTMVVGQPSTINFSKFGSIGNLKIEYIHNGNSTVITPGAAPGPEGAPGAASYVWSAVDATDSGAQSVIDVGGSKNSTLKLTGLTQIGGALEATATSLAFQIRGNLQNLRFDGSGTEGQVLYIAGSHFIEWRPSGNLGNVRIRLDRFGGNGPDLAPATGDEFNEQLSGPDGTYPNAESIPYNHQMVGGVSKWEWTVPDSSTNQALIRIESLDNPVSHVDAAMRTFLATSSGTPFRIRGTYSNISPTTAVKWKINSVNNIDWTPSAPGMGNVNITLYYDSDNNGSMESTSTLANNTGVKPFPWTISNTALVTEKAVIRIQQTTDGTGTVFAESAEFKIKPLLQLLLPNSNADQWVVGSQYDVTWAAPLGAATAFKVNISTNGGTNWNDGAVTSGNNGGLVVGSAPSAAGEYSDWTVPDVMTNQAMIRIRKVGDSDIEATDDSNGFFYIKGSITNVHIKNAALDADPSVPLDLPIATVKYITWNYTGSLGTVDLSYSTDANVGSPTYTPIPGGTGVSVGSGGVGSFAWTIPNSPSAYVRVKVTSSTNANWQTVNGLSFASAGPVYNSIIGSITAVNVVSDANGTDAVVGANPKTILWTPNGAIPLFDIYYNYDGGAWILIGNSQAGTVVGSDRTWTWANPLDTISSDVEYRVEDEGNPTKTFLNTNANYRIRGSIDLTNPNGSNTLTIGTPFNITWTKTGSIGNVKIEMSNDNFVSDVRTISNSYASANSPYAWTPSATVAPVINYADMNADVIKIRLTSIGGIPVSDPSANAFKIVGQITNIAPTGSANIWYKGESQNISWSQIGNISAVDIYYRTSGGATPYDILIVNNNTGHTNGANSFTWNPVHDVNSEAVQIRVQDRNNSDVLADSAAAFSIRPTITVTSPIASDRLVVGDTTQTNIIKWTKDGTTGNVKVLYDSGSGYLDPANVIADNVPVGNGVAGIAWNPIPNAISSTVRIKVVDKSNLNVFDESDVFKIKGSITMAAPTTGASQLNAGSNQNVNWSMTGTLPALDVEYNLNGGVGGWTSIGQAGVGNTSIAWNPIPTTTSNTARVRIKADYVDNDLDLTTTGTDFYIKNVFSALLPTNGAVVKVGDTLPHITWNVGTGTGITAVKIEYTNNQSAGGAGPTWTTVTDTAPNTGDFAWTWPGALADLNNDARLRITQWNPQNASTEFVATGSPFSIQPLMTVTEPGAGSESWGVNTPHDIKFTKRGAIQTVNFYYAPDGVTFNPTPLNGSPVNVSALADDTVFTWSWLIDSNTALTSGFTGKVKVKINTPGAQAAVEAIQSNSIEVKGTLALNTPSASGITLYVGDTYNDITWTKFGAITNVDLHYSVNGGAYNNAIATNIASTPSVFAWTVPNSIDANIRIRVRDTNNNNVFDISDNSFRILGKISLTVPDLPGITWVVGQNNKTISWTSTGTFSSVDIHFARYGNFGDAPNVVNIGTFSNCTPVNPAITCNGSADWTQVLDRISATTRIRVRDTGFPSDVVDISANDFKVVGSFTSLSNPASGAVWNVGDVSKQIQWNANGTITNVKLEYKTSAGGSWVAPAIVDSDAGHTSGANTFNWTAGIPDVNTEDAYIRVSDANFAEVTPFVSAAFKIRPVITVSEPTAAQELTVGTNYPNLIKWSKTGTTITQVKILYSTDGTNFPDPANVIADNVPVGNGVAGVSWNIPDSVTLSSTAKIRVVDKGNGNVLGDSPAFILKGGLTLTAPSGSGTTWIAGSTTNSVTWTYKGAFSVEVRYDPNSGNGADGNPGGGDDYPVLIGTRVAPGSNSGANSLNWDLSTATGTNTTTVSNKGRIKIFDPANPTTVVSASAADFNIGGQFDLLTPEAGATTLAENSYNITWTPVAGTGISDVKIEYSNNSEDSTPTWTEIASGTVKPNTGSYSWNPVPGALLDLNNTNKIRISQKNPLNFATVNVGDGAPFKIVPTLEVTAPGGAGNTTLKVGTAYPIKLKKKGAVQSVDFYYSHDGTNGNYVKINGAAVDISGAADGNGEYTFNWTPLEAHTLTIGFAGKIKAAVVSPSTQNTIEDVQSNSTELTGDLVLNTPTAGGIILEVSDTYPITWTKFSVSSVKLFYSTDGGTAGGGSYPGAPNITTVSATPASFNWSVPDQIGANLRVQIVDNNNPLVVKESASVFTIRGKLLMDTVLPASLRVNDNQDIKWTPKGTMATVKLEYSTDDFTLAGNIFPILGPSGESAATLAAGANNVQQTFTWRVPNNISNTVKVRVVNNANAAVKGTSNVSKIIGRLVLTAPVGGGGVFYKVNDPFTITWQRHGSIAQARLEYSTNNFVNETQTTLITTATATDLSFPWTIPNNIGSNVAVRISDPAYNGSTVFTEQSVSSAFEIRGQIKFNASRVAPGPDSPVGSEVWLIGTDRMLQWEKHGTIPSVKVEYKVGAAAYAYVRDSGNNAASSVAGDTFNWRVPDDKGLNNVTVKVTNLGDNNVFMTSNTFTIRAGFTWTDPSAVDQVFNQGQTYILTWTNNGTVGSVDLKYSTNGDNVYDGDADPNFVFMKNNLGVDADGINNTGSFNWPVPTNIAASKNVYLVIADNVDVDAKNVSPKVKIAGVLTMDEPDNTPIVERWGVTTNQDIRWTMVGNVSNVKIDFTKDITAGSPVWETPAIANSVVASTLTYQWTNIPSSAVTAKAAIRVSDTITDSGTAPAISPLFKIVGTFTPSAPVTANVWATTGTQGSLINPTKNIVWSTQGAIPRANLYYSTTGNTPGAWTLINGGGPINDGGAGGSFAWTVPQVFSDNMVIRIQDDDDSLTYYDTGVFTVRGDLKITSPVGGELWGVQEVQSITWESVGIVGTPNEVYIYYKKSAGGAWIQLQRPTLEYNISNTGSFAWTPPESELSTAAYVKVENIIAPTDTRYVATQSPAPFKLMRRYQLVDPDGGEVYVAGTAKDILWNKWGTPAGDVRIDVALDGVNFTTNITTTTPNDGVFAWTPLASQVAPAAKLRIRDVNDTANEMAYISQTPFVIRATLIQDAMPATVNIGDVYDILWTRQGDIPNVRIVYTTTGNFALDSRNIEDLNGNVMAGGIVANQDTVSGNSTRGRHRWKVPDLILSERAALRLRIVDPNDDPGSENISAAFRIIPKFTVTAPVGNPDPNLTDKLKVGVPYNITWTSTSSSAADKTPNVTILYSVNGGGSYPNTITTTANDGSYSWTVPATGGVPDDISDQVKVKVLSATVAENMAEDASDNNIKIISNFTITTPNGGATYEVGDPLTIAWTKLGSASNVALSYSINGSNFGSPINIVNPTANDLSEAWPSGVPDAIGTNVRVRIKSTTDDGEDISDASFRIRGKLTVTAPANGTPVPIGQTYRIQWTTNGTIPNVTIKLDTQDGAGGYPVTIANNVANTNFFDWPNVPDTGTPDARIQVIDSRGSESDVIGTSAKFNIVGNFTILTPSNGTQWVVGSSENVTWNWGGTIRYVTVSYTTNPALAETAAWTVIQNIDYGAGSGDGNNGTSVRTFPWTIPDTIAPQVRFKVENTNDASVYDVSTGTFTIRGGFTLTAPALNDRWVTNEVRNISWTTSGTIPQVKIEYSYNNFATAGIVVSAQYANNGNGIVTNFPWTIPDAGIANVPRSTKVRVSDFNDANTSALSNAFNIDYYNITWEIRDLVTNASLSQLTVNEVKASDPLFVQWAEAGISTNPPRVQKTPFGTWVATWSKAGFGDGVQVVVANSDQSILLFMETSTVHIWLADSEVSYTPATLTVQDKLEVVAWLSRDGSITTGATGAVYKIYDGSTLLYTLNDNTVDAAGFMNFTVAGPTGFVIGKTYTAICEVTVGSGGVFKTPSSFEITTPQTLQQVKNTIDANIDKPLSQINTELQNTLNVQTGTLTGILNTQTTTINTKLDAQTVTITNKLNDQTTLIQTALTSFENTINDAIVDLNGAAQSSLASADVLRATALKFSWKAVVAPNPVLQGDDVTMNVQGPGRLFPKVSIYNNSNDEVHQSVELTEDPTRPGNYKYTFKVDSGDFKAGEAYTYLVTESTTGGLVAGSGFVESISLTSVAGLAAAAPAAEKAAKAALEAIERLGDNMAKGGDLKDTMKMLKAAVEDFKYQQLNIPERENRIMRQRVAEITEKLKSLAGDQGLNFDEIFKKAIDESSTIQEIKGNTSSLHQAVDLIGAVVEKRLGGVEEPIVDVQFESAS